ncbi:hypothetical protein ACWEQ8_02530 [Streptomyces noursei]
MTTNVVGHLLRTGRLKTGPAPVILLSALLPLAAALAVHLGDHQRVPGRGRR